MNEEWLSAHLDGELSAAESAELEAALAADSELARTYDELSQVRSMLRTEPVAVSDAVLGRLVGAAELDDDDAVAPVTVLASRRRISIYAAVAAAVAIIAGVVGGLSGPASLPALGDLVARHEVAAAVAAVDLSDEMPDDMPDDMEPMPMAEASDAALAMPGEFAMEKAFVEGSMVHLVYRAGDGEAVSVFRHEGEVDVDELGDGAMAHGKDATMWSAPMHESYVAVVDGDGYVWVVVSEEPHDEMMDEMMDELPRRDRSFADRVRDAADSLVDAVTFWD